MVSRMGHVRNRWQQQWSIGLCVPEDLIYTVSCIVLQDKPTEFVATSIGVCCRHFAGQSLTTAEAAEVDSIRYLISTIVVEIGCGVGAVEYSKSIDQVFCRNTWRTFNLELEYQRCACSSIK